MPKRRNIEDHPLRKKRQVGNGKGKLQPRLTADELQKQAKLSHASIRARLEDIKKEMARLCAEKIELESCLEPTISPGLMDHELHMPSQHSLGPSNTKNRSRSIEVFSEAIDRLQLLHKFRSENEAELRKSIASREEENESLKEKLYNIQQELNQMTLFDEAKTRVLDNAETGARDVSNENTEDEPGSGSAISEEE
ncbi:hypothetical protein HG530_008636 [Fusarium avenaceum]|nr:hypothetical protein HG530_008636 [Fusarium avenaceum]